MIPRGAVPPRLRAVVYWVIMLGGVLLSSIGAGLVSVDADWPTWYKVALAVWPILTAPFGGIAAANVYLPPKDTDTPAPGIPRRGAGG